MKRAAKTNPRYTALVSMLKEASRAWYARLKTFLLEHGYVMGSVDNTLFTLKYGNDFLLV